MGLAGGSYPHPVVGNHDDVDSMFEVCNASFTPTVDDLEVKFRIRLGDDEMRQMMSERQAGLCARWSCAATLSSGDLAPMVVSHHADGESYEGWLDQRQIRDKVRIDVQVVATVDLPTYHLSRQHSDYGDQTFNVRAGDVLADGGWFEVSAEKLYDPMQPPLGSCFRVVRDEKLSKKMEVDFGDDDQVVIRLPYDMAAGLNALGHLPQLQLALVVLPALMETLAFVERTESDEQGEDLSGKAWYSPIKELMAPFASEPSSLVVAQRILHNPLAVSLTTPLVIQEED